MPPSSRTAIRAIYAQAFASAQSTFALDLPEYLDAYVAARAVKEPGFTFLFNTQVITPSHSSRNVELMIGAMNNGLRLVVLDLYGLKSGFWPGTKQHNLLLVLLEAMESGRLISPANGAVVATAKPGFAVDAFWKLAGTVSPSEYIERHFPVKMR
jgi:hypothetical protein